MANDLPILFVNAHYYPDIAATAHHLTDLAEYLAANGQPVEICTSRGKYVAGRMLASETEVRNGVRINRVRSTAHGRGTIVGRLI
ncbi:MAG TPA: hypothetical protein VIB98_00650, partial [Gemmatimonadaceae bacterium]